MVDRFMRIIVFFDLPVSTRAKRKEYAKFRKFLINDGYIMLQYSVYSKTVRNFDDAKKHCRYLQCFVPPEGSCCRSRKKPKKSVKTNKNPVKQ